MQQGIEVRAARQRLGLGVAAPQPVPDLVDGEAVLAVAQAQPRQRPEPQPQGTLGRHPTGIEFLAGRHGGRFGSWRRRASAAARCRTAGSRAAAAAGRPRRVPGRPAAAAAAGRTPPAGPPCAQLLGERRQLRRAGHDHLPGHPAHLEPGDRHRGLRLDRRPGHRRRHPLLVGRFRGGGGGPQQDRQVDDLGDRDDPAEPLDLLAEFVAERRDRRVLAPAGTVGRHDLARHGLGRCRGRRRCRSGWATTSGGRDSAASTPSRAVRMRHSASFFGILTPTTRCSSRSRVGGPDGSSGAGWSFDAARIDAGEPPPQLGHVVDDLPPGLDSRLHASGGCRRWGTPAGCGR